MLRTTTPTVGAAEVLFEAVQHERALQFLAHAAGQDRDEREHRRLAPACAASCSSGLVRHVVQRRREQPQRVQQDADRR